MHIQHVYAVYFSPTGNTKRLVCACAAEAARLFQVPCRALSLDLPAEREAVRTFSAGDLVIVGAPTYAGKLPNKILPTYQEKLRSHGALAIAIVTYGNRSFDNSLAELCNVLSTNGFRQRPGPLSAHMPFPMPWHRDGLMNTIWPCCGR
ncbi:hypothetical protein [uncultured Megasphaera sp.]|uniref:flavodoxin family protein n=1 Tax=uncultured Megasphaera sp. TaxID=165188 RepID=UPI002805E4D3|nr:hypothetical protein [uncultured Megasphaera sp.]